MEEKMSGKEKKNSYLVDLINTFPAFITFTLDPVTVQIGTDSIQYLARELVVFPLLGVVAEDIFTHQTFTTFPNVHEIEFEELSKPLIQFLTDKLSSTGSCSNMFVCFGSLGRNWLSVTVVSTCTIIVDISVWKGREREEVV